MSIAPDEVAFALDDPEPVLATLVAQERAHGPAEPWAGDAHAVVRTALKGGRRPARLAWTRVIALAAVLLFWVCGGFAVLALISKLRGSE